MGRPGRFEVGDRIRNFHVLKALAGRAEVDVVLCQSVLDGGTELDEEVRELCGETRVLAPPPGGPPPSGRLRVLRRLLAPRSIPDVERLQDARRRLVRGTGRRLGRLSDLARDRIVRGVERDCESGVLPPARAAIHGEAIAQLGGALADLAPPGSYDAVWFGHILLQLALDPVRRHSPGAHLVFDLHGLESRHHELLAQAASGAATRRWYEVQARACARLEDEVAREADAVNCLSALERDRLAARASDGPRANLRVVTNGAETDHFAPTRGPDAQPTVLYLGGMSFPPNVMTVERLLASILPRVRAAVPETRLLIVGRDAESKCRPLVGDDPLTEIVSDAPDIRPLLERASVVLAPLVTGCGASRLKIVEALSMGRVQVATTYAAEGYDVEDGVHLLLRDDEVSFADAVVELLRDPARRDALGAAARRLAVERLDWGPVAAHSIEALPWARWEGARGGSVARAEEAARA